MRALATNLDTTGEAFRANEQAMPSVKEYQSGLAGTNVVLRILPGLTHTEELTRVDEVLPSMLKFLLGAAAV